MNQTMHYLKYSVFVAVGGSVGAVLRFWMTDVIHIFFERGFPLGTLTVNVVGSFIMGFLSTLLFAEVSINSDLRALLSIGLLGAFTTFSTFSLDTIELFAAGKIGWAFSNLFFSVVLCVAAAGLGVVMAQ